MKTRLDKILVERGLANTRSQAENLIKLGKVKVDGRLETRPSYTVDGQSNLELEGTQNYVSRAAYKLESALAKIKLDFAGKTVLDVGASTGGFTQIALSRGAKRVYAVDIGTAQLHPTLRADERVTVMEKTDIRGLELHELVDIALADVSFISLQQVLPAVADLLKPGGKILAMVKPQFEAGALRREALSKGVVKNDTWRRRILKEFEGWVLDSGFKILDKTDSEVSGAKGNIERFILLSSKR